MVGKTAWDHIAFLKLIGPGTAEGADAIGLPSLGHVKEEGHAPLGVSRREETENIGVPKHDVLTVLVEAVGRKGIFCEIFQIVFVQIGLGVGAVAQQSRCAARVIVMAVCMQNDLDVADVKAECRDRINDDLGGVGIARIDEDQPLARVDHMAGSFIRADEIHVSDKTERSHI